MLEKNQVAVFSSNYNLYGDMSKRVMSLLSRYTPRLTQYSIDEAFLDLSGMDNLQEYCRDNGPENKQGNRHTCLSGNRSDQDIGKDGQ